MGVGVDVTHGKTGFAMSGRERHPRLKRLSLTLRRMPLSTDAESEVQLLDPLQGKNQARNKMRLHVDCRSVSDTTSVKC